MGLFKSNKSKPMLDARIYAFTGLGLTARYMNEKQLGELAAALPALMASAFGIGQDNIVVVQSHEWTPAGKEYANAINNDGTPVDPNAAHKLCEDYLRGRNLNDHRIGDILLLGIIHEGRLTFGT